MIKTKKAENVKKTSGRGRIKEIIAVLIGNGIVKGVTPQKLRMVMEGLGPTFIKFGQILSMRPDIIPAEYCDELAKLKEDVCPMSFSEVKGIIESEYGRGLYDVFKSFDKEPLGSASIAQVHKAVVKGGCVAAVKVQRKGIRETMALDIKLLRRASKLMKFTKIGNMVDMNNILDEIWTAALQETDFLTEEKNADEFRRLNRDVVFFECPEIVHIDTTPKILVMKYIDGLPIDDVSGLLEDGYDLQEIGIKLADNYIKQVIDDGFFHADPHPGNLRIKGGKIVWLDMGMMGRLSAKDQKLLKDGVKAIAKKNIPELENIILAMAVYSSPVKREIFKSDVSAMFEKYAKMELGDMDLGKIFNDVTDIAKKHGLALPSGVFMLGRGLMHLQGILTVLSPEINLMEIMSNRMSSAIFSDMDMKKELQAGLFQLYKAGRSMADVPLRFSDFLSVWTEGGGRLTLKIDYAEKPLKTVDNTAGKFVKAILASSLFIGACIVCLSDMHPKIFGVHIIGWLAFAVSFILGANVLWNIRKK